MHEGFFIGGANLLLPRNTIRMKYYRKTIRLKNYDYSQNGIYFVTICVKNRNCLFGKFENGKIQLNDTGRMIDMWWNKMFEKYNEIQMDKYAVMPNHMHGIIHIVGAIPRNRPIANTIPRNRPDIVGANPCICPNNNEGENMVSPVRKNIIPNQYKGLGQYVSWFKRMTTNVYIRGVKNNNWPPFEKQLWQRNYYEHVVRDDNDLNRIRQYINDNPLNWDADRNNPNNWNERIYNQNAALGFIGIEID